MLSFLLNLTVKEGCVDKAIEALSAIDRATQEHKGKITFMWFQHLDNPKTFSLLEQWENQAALDAHIPRIIDIWNGFTPCLDGDPVSIKLRKLVR
jgi:quinol monooxygenase YgiN